MLHSAIFIPSLTNRKAMPRPYKAIKGSINWMSYRLGLEFSHHIVSPSVIFFLVSTRGATEKTVQLISSFKSLSQFEFLLSLLFQNGQTPLMVAAEQGNLEIVQELIRRGANVNLDDVVSMQMHTRNISSCCIWAYLPHIYAGTHGIVEMLRAHQSRGTGEKQCGHFNHITHLTMKMLVMFHLAELTTLRLSPQLLWAIMSHNYNLVHNFTFTLLTKWQDPLAGQHPVSPGASPYTRTHSRIAYTPPLRLTHAYSHTSH